ncbi:MAG: anaerobic ribonucleoside-triphosphate reductase activating protein [Ruminococcaceae bacterium]|nr:anaerobic ribonucleoside-triphosphate reductase activating protein [Oscillospiraceae bacterium]
MLIKGLQKTTLLDFPQKVACTVFTGGCNFRCPFCHNASLVLGAGDADSISEDEFFSFLQKRKNILDGVCITGGEPILQVGLEDFIKRIRDMGFAVKLDTNGSYPDRLGNLLSKGLLDYVAVDVKNSKEKYPLTCGTEVDTKKISESISMLICGNTPYEFRTTVVREHHTPQDIVDITEWIKGTKKYFLQCFTDSGDLISDGLSAYSPEEMAQILALAQKNIPETELRGI